MPTLAHEGNPKEDQITITGGSVLSTAQLDLDFLFFGEGNPNFAGPGVPVNVPSVCAFIEDARTVESCEQKLIIDRYDSGSYGATVKLHGAQVGCGTLGTPQMTPTTPFFNFEVLSGRHDGTTETQGNFAGFSIWQGVVPPPASSPAYNETAAIWTQSSGQPVSGYCFFVPDDATPCDFTGIVCMIDTHQAISWVGYYVHADLHSDNAVVLGTGPLPTSGQGVYAYCTTPDYFGVGADDIQFWSDGGNLVLINDASSVIPSIIQPTATFGIIWIPLPVTLEGAHTARWQYGFSAWNVDG